MQKSSLRIVLVMFALSFAHPPADLAAQQMTGGAAAPQPSAQVSQLLSQGFDLLSRNDATAAEVVFRKAIDLQPEVGAAHRGLGLALRARGQAEAALQELRTAARLAPGDADTHYDLGTLAWSLMDQPPLAPGSGTQRLDYQDLATAELTKAAALEAHNFQFHLALADFDLDAGRKSAAVQEAEEAVRLATSKPLEARARVSLGRCYFAIGEENKAAAEFQHAVELNPAESEALVELGRLWLFQRKLPQAEQAFRQAIRAVPNAASAYAALGEVLSNKGQAGEARKLLEKAVALDPHDWHSLSLLASLVMDAGEAGRAVDLLKQATALRPDYLPAREELGMAYLRRGDLNAAQEQAETLVARAPQAAEGHRLMALLLWKRRDYETALSECALALASDPDSARMLALQAICLWQLDRKKDARDAFLAAGKVEPKVGTADVFCRLLLCDTRDIGIVGVFLQKNRWVLQPLPEQ